MNSLSSGIVITSAHWAQMEADVSSRSLEEACGLVVGEGKQANMVIPVTNILHNPYRFLMDPKEELEAFQLIESKGWEVLAIYHSHPGGISMPSATDFSELTFPGVLYLIWFHDANAWRCRGYLMDAQAGAIEVPVIISTKQ